MNEWCIYIALYFILLYTKSSLQSCGGGGSLLNHHQCAASTWMMWRLPQDSGTSALQVEMIDHRANQVDALATHQLQVEMRESHRPNQVDALTTHQLQVERRESHRGQSVYALTHTSYRWRGERRHRAIQVYALTTHQLQVERRESQRANQVDVALTTHQLQVERRKRVIEPIKCMRSPHPSYRWRGERVIEPIKYKYNKLSSDELYLSHTQLYRV